MAMQRNRLTAALIVTLALGGASGAIIPGAAAGDEGSQMRAIFVYLTPGQKVRQLHVSGTDRGDSVTIEPVDAERLQVSVGFGQVISLDDAAGACVQTEPKAVVCPDDLDGLHVIMGDGKDQVSFQYGLDPHPVEIDSGAGDDRVYVWNDYVNPGGSFVRIFGRGGNDTISDFHDRVGLVTSFMGGRGDEEAEGVSRARGGSGDDVLATPLLLPAELLGGPGRDLLSGRAGDDDLRGGSGADRITDTGGDDVVYGGGGPDQIESDDGGHDDLNCGPGLDRVRRDWRDFTFRCETVS
jgi:Ca2+-binding RTX toxin-like protein